MSRSSLRPRLLVGAALALIALAATGLLSRALAPLGDAVRAVAAPVHAIGERLRGADPNAKDAELLAAELDAARAENAKLARLKEENDQLKAALAYRETTKETVVAARVIARTSDAVFHGVVIDKGSEDGLRPGQPVIAGDGVIIGKTYDVRARTAGVMALTDGKSRLAVTVGNVEGTAGVLEGERGISTRVTLVPSSFGMAPGDTVITSGLEAGIRRGLLVGTIDQITRNSQDPFQSASIERFAAAVNPTYVQVILGE